MKYSVIFHIFLGKNGMFLAAFMPTRSWPWARKQEDWDDGNFPKPSPSSSSSSSSSLRAYFMYSPQIANCKGL